MCSFFEMKRLAWHKEQLSLLSWVRDVFIVKFFTLSEFSMWALTLLKGKKGWHDADGRSFIFTYLPPSLGTFRRAALTWCQQYIACCSCIHLSLFAGSLLPMAFLFIMRWRMHSWKADQMHDIRLYDLHYQLYCYRDADRCLQEESVYSGAIQVCMPESLAQE